MYIDVYTDGSCLGNPGPGGYAAVINIGDDQTILSGGEHTTTNNRMEMRAIVEALRWIRYESGISEQEVLKAVITVFSDSNLIVQTLNLGWKKKANKDLWDKIEVEKAWLNIKWTWVKGHASNKYNNLADEEAVREAKKQQKHQKLKK